MNDIMLDLEAMGECLVQIAAIVFDIRTGEIGEKFCINIDSDTCRALGYKYDDLWWKTQDPKILASILENPIPVKTALILFIDFVKRHNQCKIWSHSLYDFTTVQNYIANFRDLKRLSYKKSRDITTLVSLSGISLKKYDKTLKTHHALDDCKYQIMYCVDAYRKLKQDA